MALICFSVVCRHPWYVFKGHPIPHGSEAKDSLVSYNTCPTPESIQDAFLRACPKAAILDPYRNGDAKSRELYVNAQWALGGEGTGAPVSSFHKHVIVSLILPIFLFIRFTSTTQLGKSKYV